MALDGGDSSIVILSFKIIELTKAYPGKKNESAIAAPNFIIVSIELNSCFQGTNNFSTLRFYIRV